MSKTAEICRHWATLLHIDQFVEIKNMSLIDVICFFSKKPQIMNMLQKHCC